MSFYRLKFAPDEGTVLVTSPDFPDLITYGDDEAAALVHALDALETVLMSRIAHNEDAPIGLRKAPRGPHVELSAMADLKLGLYRQMRLKGMTRADLTRLLGWQREAVERLFRLDHQTKLDTLAAAFAALGATLRFEIEEAA